MVKKEGYSLTCPYSIHARSRCNRPSYSIINVASYSIINVVIFSTGQLARGNMSDRYCVKCGRRIIGIAGLLCLDCKLDKTPESQDESLRYSELYYDTKDMSSIMVLSERQVRRKAHDDQIPGKVPGIKRHLFDKKKVDKWREGGYKIPKTPKLPKPPTSPLQEEALAKCRKKDHSWLSDPKYDGIAYTSKPTTVKQTKYTVLAGYKRTCYFCKFSTFVLA